MKLEVRMLVIETERLLLREMVEDEFADEVNDVTKVFAISREEWSTL